MARSRSLGQRALSGGLMALLACTFAVAGCGKYGKPTRRASEEHALAPEKRYILGTAPRPPHPLRQPLETVRPERQVSKQDRSV